MNLDLGSFVEKLQSLAHEGYALHNIAVCSRCNNCETHTTLVDPDIDIQVDEATKTIVLKFKEDCDD